MGKYRLVAQHIQPRSPSPAYSILSRCSFPGSIFAATLRICAAYSDFKGLHL